MMVISLVLRLVAVRKLSAGCRCTDATGPGGWRWALRNRLLLETTSTQARVAETDHFRFYSGKPVLLPSKG